MYLHTLFNVYDVYDEKFLSTLSVVSFSLFVCLFVFVWKTFIYTTRTPQPPMGVGAGFVNKTPPLARRGVHASNAVVRKRREGGRKSNPEGNFGIKLTGLL